MAETPINTLEGPLLVLRENEMRLLADISTTLTEVGEMAEEDRKRLLEVAQDLRDLFFLVVVIGEFNAGKSTFINALLGEPLLPTGITPTTEVIELIKYGDEAQRKPVSQDEGIRRWEHPNTGGPGVAIVDTPGTGSVFQKHEKIAKTFLHRSDLVIFVISAKRALAETERLYLELAKSYGKKIILVVNQIDLLQPSERTEVRRFVEQQVKELLDLQPLVFMVSAKEALATNGAAGGVDAVRAHLRGVFAEVPPTKQKLLAQLETAETIVRRYHNAMQGKVDLVTADTAKVREVQSELQQQSLGLEAQLDEVRAEIRRVVEGIRQRGLNFIDTNLSIRKLGRSPDRDKLQAEFQDVVISRASRDINEATSSYVNAVIDHSRLYWRGVIDRLNQLHELMEQEFGGLDAGVYAEQRENLQEAIRIAEAELRSYSSGRIVEEIQHTFQTNMSGFTNSALAVVGGLILTLLGVAAPGGLVGAGAAPLAFPAVVIGAPIAAIGGIVAWRYYRRVTAGTKAEFNARINQLEKTYFSALDDLTQKERNRLNQYGTQVLTPIFSRLEVLFQRYDQQKARLGAQLDAIRNLRKEIEGSR